MAKPVKFRVQDGVAIVTLHQPAGNVLDAAVRTGLAAVFERLPDRADVQAVVLVATGDNFSVGGDITELDSPVATAPSLADICIRIEDCAVPVVAGLHGRVLGGGAELALAAHYRLGAGDTHIGLPEVTLGLPPHAGGTQRLPRLVGVEVALQMLFGAHLLKAEYAHKLGLLDSVVTGPVVDAACTFARDLLNARKGPRPTSQRRARFTDAQGYLAACNSARAAIADSPLIAPPQILDCLEAAVLLPFSAGLAREAAAFETCLRHPQSVALRHIFIAERRAVPAVLSRDGATFRVVDPAGVAVLKRLRAAWHDAAAALITADLSQDDIGRIMVDFGFRKGPFGLQDGNGPTAKASDVQQAIIAALMAQGARMIADGTARSAADIDAVAIHGLGFPRRHGGPMRAAQTIGLLGLVRRVAPLAARDDLWKMPPIVAEAIKYAGGFDALAKVQPSPE